VKGVGLETSVEGVGSGTSVEGVGSGTSATDQKVTSKVCYRVRLVCIRMPYFVLI